MSNWSSESLGFEVSRAFYQHDLSFQDQPFTFSYKAAQIQYASSTFTPKIRLQPEAYHLFQCWHPRLFDQHTLIATGGGTYSYVNFSSPYQSESGTILGYNWIQEAYRGDLSPIIYSGFVAPMFLKVNFANASITNGTVSGTMYPYYPSTFNAFGVGGTFILN